MDEWESIFSLHISLLSPNAVLGNLGRISIPDPQVIQMEDPRNRTGLKPHLTQLQGHSLLGLNIFYSQFSFPFDFLDGTFHRLFITRSIVPFFQETAYNLDQISFHTPPPRSQRFLSALMQPPIHRLIFLRPPLLDHNPDVIGDVGWLAMESVKPVFRNIHPEGPIVNQKFKLDDGSGLPRTRYGVRHDERTWTSFLKKGAFPFALEVPLLTVQKAKTAIPQI